MWFVSFVIVELKICDGGTTRQSDICCLPKSQIGIWVGSHPVLSLTVLWWTGSIHWQHEQSSKLKEVENCALLGYYAASTGNFLPTFRHNLLVPSSGGQGTKGSWDRLSRNVGPTFKGQGTRGSWDQLVVPKRRSSLQGSKDQGVMVPIGCPETSERDYHYSLPQHLVLISYRRFGTICRSHVSGSRDQGVMEPVPHRR